MLGDKVMEVVQQMPKEGMISESYTHTLVSGFEKKGDMDNVIKVIREMEGKGVKLSVATYGVLIDGLVKMKEVDESFNMLKEMEKKGLKANIATWNAMIDRGRIKEGMEIMQQMKREGMDVDIVAYNALVTGFAKKREMENALNVVIEMKENGINIPSINSWIHTSKTNGEGIKSG